MKQQPLSIAQARERLATALARIPNFDYCSRYTEINRVLHNNISHEERSNSMQYLAYLYHLLPSYTSGMSLSEWVALLK